MSRKIFYFHQLLFIGEEQGVEFAVREVILLGFEPSQFEELSHGGEFEAFGWPCM